MKNKLLQTLKDAVEDYEVGMREFTRKKLSYPTSVYYSCSNIMTLRALQDDLQDLDWKIIFLKRSLFNELEIGDILCFGEDHRLRALKIVEKDSYEDTLIVEYANQIQVLIDLDDLLEIQNIESEIKENENK